jgi:hypothetical protein
MVEKQAALKHYGICLRKSAVARVFAQGWQVTLANQIKFSWAASTGFIDQTETYRNYWFCGTSYNAAISWEAFIRTNRYAPPAFNTLLNIDAATS